MAMSETGFDGVSTRAIAQRAGVSQGLLTYHFASKDMLWRAAADHLFATQEAEVGDAMADVCADDPLETRREVFRRLVRFNAAHPEFFRFLIVQGVEDAERTNWLVETHLAPIYKRFARVMGNMAEADIPHAFYVAAGASGVIFCAKTKCQTLTGIDPKSESAIERHADFLASLMVRE